MPGKKSDLWWWWWWLYSGAAQVKQRDCRTCRARQGRAGRAMVTGRRPTEETKDSDRKTGAAEKRELRTRNTDRMSAGPAWHCHSHHHQTSTHHLNTFIFSHKLNKELDTRSSYPGQRNTKYFYLDCDHLI